MAVSDEPGTWRDDSSDPDPGGGGPRAPVDEPRGAFPDSAWTRIRTGWPGAAMESGGSIRRFLGWEILIVLAIFPLGVVVSAVTALIQQLQEHQAISNISAAPVDGIWLSVLLGGLDYATQLAAPALVFYLLARSGEGVQSINLGNRRLRMDFALLLPVFIVVFVIPQNVGSHLLHVLDLHGFRSSGGGDSDVARAPLLTTGVIMAVTAGIVEEIVVLGFLVRRLEQRGYRTSTIVAIAVMVRVAYHVYYGWDVLPIALWAFVSVVVYLRVRRLLPFIICHVVWDIGIPLGILYRGAYAALVDLGLLAGIVATVLWIRWIPDSDRALLAPSGAPGLSMSATVNPSGWYPDPAGRHHWRYWDGWAWTSHISTHGVTGTDPLD